MVNNIDLKAAFYMEPTEIVEYFKSKGLKTSYDWHEVWEDAHAKAFTVAKMTEIDLLKDTQDLLTKTIKEGKSYNEFKKEASNLFAKKGWVGKKEVTNPHTGEKETVELGTPRRIRNIYVNNINSAYAVGRYKEQLEEIDVAPYWQYKTMADGRERPEHRAMHDKVFRADDPFWNNFYPPNGWGCRCYVKSLTKRDVEKLGIKVEKSEGAISSVTETVGKGETAKEVQTPTYTFDNVGQVMTLTPDAGWGTNLGVKAWGIDVQAWNKVEGLPEVFKYDFISKMASNPHKKAEITIWMEKIFESRFKNVTLEKTLTWLDPVLFEKISKQSGLIESPVVVMQSNQVGHSGMNKNVSQALSKDEYLEIYDIVNSPDEVYWDYTNTKWKQIAFIRKLSNGKCIKVCVRFDQKSRLKNRKYLISRVTTVGKVDYTRILKNKDFKKIE